MISIQQWDIKRSGDDDDIIKFTYLIILFGSTPQLAAIKTFGSACSILIFNSRAAKPIIKFILHRFVFF